MDFTALTSAINFASVLTAIGSVAVAVAGLYVAIRGARIVLGFIKR